jgi:N-methylhydantoinase B/oxoprolinase/acetone carboxylase alpha subunit
VKITVLLEKGDVIEVKTAGGGGYGKGENREKSRSENDIENEIISSPYARRAHYRISSGT